LSGVRRYTSISQPSRLTAMRSLAGIALKVLETGSAKSAKSTPLAFLVFGQCVANLASWGLRGL
jgi:hypothetical protein